MCNVRRRPSIKGNDASTNDGQSRLLHRIRRLTFFLGHYSQRLIAAPMQIPRCFRMSTKIVIQGAKCIASISRQSRTSQWVDKKSTKDQLSPFSAKEIQMLIGPFCLLNMSTFFRIACIARGSPSVPKASASRCIG